jgi:hypothetical protein
LEEPCSTPLPKEESPGPEDSPLKSEDLLAPFSTEGLLSQSDLRCLELSFSGFEFLSNPQKNSRILELAVDTSSLLKKAARRNPPFSGNFGLRASSAGQGCRPGFPTRRG